MEGIAEKEFLRQVASHYADDAEGLGSLCFVLPSRRAMVSFQYYLSEELTRRELSMPVLAPHLLTVNDFFYQASSGKETDKVSLLLELYECYKEVFPKAEPLDEFLFWGDVILSDFNEIDKYLVNPSSLFTNIAELKAMTDDWSDLTENQRQAIEEFSRHLRDGSKGAEKEKFLKTWDILLKLYQLFNERLREKGLSYEGMVYRDLADRSSEEGMAGIVAETFPTCSKFIFVGLNALNKCERTILRKLESSGLAEFCWDYCSEWIKDPHNMASHFMKDNILQFHQAFDISAPLGKPQINILSVPSSVGQAKQLPAILSALSGSAVPGIETAVVLPDENMLVPCLNSIPESIGTLNVTMGYPISGSAFHTLVRDICSLQLHLREKDGEYFFYHRQVWSILSSGIVKRLLNEDSLAKIAGVKAEGRYYVAAKSLGINDFLKLVFTPVVLDPSLADPGVIRSTGEYLLGVIRALAVKMKACDYDFRVDLEFARSYYRALVQLCDHSLTLTAASFFRLLERTVAMDSVHFHGEPMKGLQVMGPLETRALDFRNLVILSCNEGVFPRHNVSSSFIPHELRKAFELPTYEYQDAIWAYYFYRLLQRARKVWLVYDSRFEGVRSGEESRYIKQLELHFGAQVRRYVAKSPLALPRELSPIVKTEELDEAVSNRCLSASALKNYLDCPAKFYYSFVKGLRDGDEVAEKLDAGMLGDVFHKTMEHFYSVSGGKVSKDYLKGVLKDEERIRLEIDRRICEALKCFEVTGRNILYENIVLRYVKKTVEKDINYLESSGVEEFEILGLEKKFFLEVGGYRFKGYIDRLDSISPDCVRVIDYKTGKVEDKDVDISDDNAADIVEAIFGESRGARPKIALQIYLYDRYVRESYGSSRRIFNSIYAPAEFFTGEVKDVPMSGKFFELMDPALRGLLDEIMDKSKPFGHTSDLDTCKNCDFKTICGR